MDGGGVDGYSGSKESNTLPLAWDSERFLVIGVGKSRFAFYSIAHQRYMLMNHTVNGIAVLAGGKKTLVDPIDEMEIFDVRHQPWYRHFGGEGRVYLCFAKAFWPVRPNGYPWQH